MEAKLYNNSEENKEKDTNCIQYYQLNTILTIFTHVQMFLALMNISIGLGQFRAGIFIDQLLYVYYICILMF